MSAPSTFTTNFVVSTATPTATPTETPTATPTEPPTPSPTATVTPTYTPVSAEMATTQALSVISNGRFYAGMYNYTLNQWGGSIDSTDTGQIVYALNAGEWYGAFVYDYEAADYVAAFYLFGEEY